MAKFDPADDISPWGDRRCRNVGLLGGSFNPAHEGHLHVAQAALTHLGLDEVWFLVSPQNPLKSREDMAPFAERFRSMSEIGHAHPGFAVTGIEARLGTRYTIDTVKKLIQRFPRTRFVWLMGADNLFQISLWNRWHHLFAMLPVAIVDRPSYSRSVLASKAARRFAPFLRPPRALLQRPLPSWTFLHLRHHPASATQIRAQAYTQESSIENQSLPPSDLTGSNPVELITASLLEDKGEDILVIDLRGRTSLADYMIIGTGRSARQVGAMATHVVSRLKDAGIRSTAEGLGASDWVLIDGGDVIVHLFRPEVRAFYNLEKMWLPDDQGQTHRAADRYGEG